MKRGPGFSLISFTAALSVLCLVLITMLSLQNQRYAIVAAVCFLILVLAFVLCSNSLRKKYHRFLTGARFDGSEAQYTLKRIGQPVLLLEKRETVWYNSAFETAFLKEQPSQFTAVNKILPGLDVALCQNPSGSLFEWQQKKYMVYASEGRVKGDLLFLIFNEVTAMANDAEEYYATRPACLLFEVDGYNEVSVGLRESERAYIMEQVNRILEDTCVDQCKGYLSRITAGRYISVIEERYLKQLEEKRFDILDRVRAIDANRNLTLSIGVGRDADSYAQAQDWARQSLDMCLGRGGDQATVKGKEGFSFYGGASQGVEKQSKVQSRIVATALTEQILQSDSVLIMGHNNGDMDSLGSAIGILHMCRVCQVPAVIVARRAKTMAGLMFKMFDDAGLANNFIEPEEVLDDISPDTLLIVVDTCLQYRVESREVLGKCRRVAVIDHHRRAVGAIENAIVWYQEPYASSASEMVSEILQYVGDKDERPSPLEAEAMLAGIMLDTRNFALHTGVRTFEAAAYLRRLGASTENVKALFVTGQDEYVDKARLVEKAEPYRGFAVSCYEGSLKDPSVSSSQAANDLLTIQGIEASIVAVYKGNAVNISARSMGAVNVQVVLERLGGGGHLTMAGAQIDAITMEEASKRIRAAIDEYRAAQQNQE